MQRNFAQAYQTNQLIKKLLATLKSQSDEIVVKDETSSVKAKMASIIGKCFGKASAISLLKRPLLKHAGALTSTR